MMTEDDAKTKACHKTLERAGTFDSKTGVLTGYTIRGGNCIGSACMAFRWANKKAGHDLAYMQKSYGKERGAIEHDRFCRGEPLRGFCGLAGRPE